MNLVMIEALVGIARLAAEQGYKGKSQQFIGMISEFTDSGLEEIIRRIYERDGRVDAVKKYKEMKLCMLKDAMDNVDHMAKSRGWVVAGSCIR